MGFSVSLPFFVGTIGYVLGGSLSDHPFQKRSKVPLIVNQWIAALCLYFTYTARSPESCVASGRASDAELQEPKQLKQQQYSLLSTPTT